MLLTLAQSTFTVLPTSEINHEKGDKQVNRVYPHSFRICVILRPLLWCWKFVLYKMAEMRLLQEHGNWNGAGEEAQKNNVQAWRSRNGNAQAYYCHKHWNIQLRVNYEGASLKKTVLRKLQNVVTRSVWTACIITYALSCEWTHPIFYCHVSKYIWEQTDVNYLVRSLCTSL